MPVSFIPEASTSIWGCPFTEMMTGVLWPKAMSGNFCRHFTAPLALSKATTLESLALAIAHNRITVSWYRTGLLPTVTSKLRGAISFRQTILPWKSKAAMTIMKTLKRFERQIMKNSFLNSNALYLFIFFVSSS